MTIRSPRQGFQELNVERDFHPTRLHRRLFLIWMSFMGMHCDVSGLTEKIEGLKTLGWPDCGGSGEWVSSFGSHYQSDLGSSTGPKAGNGWFSFPLAISLKDVKKAIVGFLVWRWHGDRQLANSTAWVPCVCTVCTTNQSWRFCWGPRHAGVNHSS